MKRMILMSWLLVCAVPFAARADHEINWNDWFEGNVQVRLRMDRGEGALYGMGQPVGLKLEANEDAYHLVYGIDTDGYLRVLYPYDCYDDGYVYGGQVYRIGRGAFRRYYANGPQGVEYIHVVASATPFRRLYWHGCGGYDAYAHDVSWGGFQDYWGCALPPRIYGDPYVAMQTIDEFICLDALDAGHDLLVLDKNQTLSALRIVQEFVRDRAVSPTGSAGRGAFPFFFTDINSGVRIQQQIIHMVEMQMGDEYMSNVLGSQAELPQLGTAAFVFVLRNRLTQYMGGASIHFSQVGNAGIYKHRFVTAEYQPNVQCEVIGLVIVSLVKCMVACDFADAVTQRINPIFFQALI